MPTKFQLITELYDQTVQSVTGSYQSWTGFLRAACYNYKCPFDDQILIYAQRPDATAVLEMERWNRQFGRWVNRGAKSIAVFGDDGQNCLKLYFDVSDTHASRFARPLPIWTMHPAFEPEVIETLEATFGNLAEKENLADAVRSACHNAVADNFTDYLQDLRECREDSLLEELDDLNLEAFYRGALEVQPQSKPIPAPQEQARRAHAKQAKKSRAEKPSAWDNLYTEQPEIRLADSSPQKEVPAIREKSKAPEIRSQVHSKTTPAKPSTVRHEKQPDAWTPRSPAAPVMRGKEQSIRERSAVTQARDLSPTPQEQARQAFMEKQAQLTQNPSIESIYPSEPAAAALSSRL